MFLHSANANYSAESLSSHLSKRLSNSEINNFYQEAVAIQDKIKSYNSLESMSEEFFKYEKEYLNNQRINGKIQTVNSIDNAIKKAQVVLFADYHSHSQFQSIAQKHLQKITAKNKFIVLEWMGYRSQSLVNDYLDNNMSLEHLANELSRRGGWDFTMSPYLEMLKKAKNLGFKVLLAEDYSQELRLEKRDETIVKLISSKNNESPDSQFFVFYGAYHLMGDNHLYDRLTGDFGMKSVVITGYADNVYWYAALEERTKTPVKYYQFKNNHYFYNIQDPVSRGKMNLSYLKKTFGPSWEESLKEFEKDNDDGY